MDHQDQNGFHSFFRGIILFGFTMLLLSFILTGNIQYYIAPRMMPFIYFALAVFLLLSILQIVRSMSRNPDEEADCGCDGHHHLPAGRWKKGVVYAIFIFPLLTGFLIPDQMLDSSVAANRGVQLSENVASNGATNGANNSSATAMTQEEDELETREEEERAGNELSSDSSDMTAEDYFAELDERTERLDDDEAGTVEDGTAVEENVEGIADDEHVTYDELESQRGFDFYAEMAAEAAKEDLIQITDET